MRAWNFSAPKMALETRVNYRMYLVTPCRPDGIDYGHSFVGEIRAMREFVADKPGYRIRVEREVTAREVEACYYCQARPRAIEYDIDGPYRTATCEDDQCKRGTNPDNAGWVAGRTPLWGPGHPEWDMECETSYCILTAGHDPEGTNEHVDATGYVFTR